MCEENEYKDGFYFTFEDESFTNGYPYIEIKSNTNKIAFTTFFRKENPLSFFFEKRRKKLSKKSKKEAFSGQRAALRSPC